MYVSNDFKKVTQEFRNFLNEKIKNEVGSKLKKVEYTYTDDSDKPGLREQMELINPKTNERYYADFWHNDEFSKFEKIK